MGVFRYQALTSAGKTTQGVIEADSEKKARQLLRDQSLIPTRIVAEESKTHPSRTNRIPSQDLALLTRQLATLIAAGIPIDEALSGVIDQTEKQKPRALMLGVRSKVVEGYSLAQALGEYPHAFPELYRATVSAGEQTGKLDGVLEKLADYTENQQIIRQKVQQALIYPSLMITVSVSIIAFLLAFVVPKIIDVFSSSGQTLPDMTRVLIGMSHGIKAYGLYGIVIFVLLGMAFHLSLKRPHILYQWHRLLLRIPLASYLIKANNVARYIHTFSILFSAGVNVLDTMSVSSSLLSNRVMRDAFDTAAKQVKEGTTIHQALKGTGFLSPMAVHLIASGEKSGQVASMMDRAALHLDNDVKRLIDTALTLLEPLIILFMGAVVLFIVLATLLPIFSMEQLVG